MKAMILAAGYGTRLWPLTIDRTKPAIPVMGRPLAGYVAEYLAAYGITEVLVNLHHRPESVRAALGDGRRFGVRLSYIEENEILGTGGALDNAKEWLAGGDFVVINGKIVTDINLGEVLAAHQRAGALATLVLRPNPARERFSEVRVSEGAVRGFGGMPVASDNNRQVPLMFTGIQVLSSDIFRYIPRGRFSHTTVDVYPPAIAAGEIVKAHVAEGNWYELSTIQRYLETALELLKSSGAGASLSAGAVIEAGAEVKETILWENAIVERGAVVERAILGAGVKIKSGTRLKRVAVVRAALVSGQIPPEKALPGYFAGDNFVVPLG
jgi:NDP-sugar pyrophosphorylase family protein